MSRRFSRRRSARGLFAKIPLRLVLALSMAWLVAACLDERWDPKPVEASQSAIRFDHADFDPELAEYALDRDPRTGNELHLARFFGADAFGALLVTRTAAGYVVEERTTEINVSRLMNDAELEWGDSGRVPTRMGHVRYRIFQFADQPVSCLGFSHTFGETHDDRSRKGNLVIGYFCYDETHPPSAATAAGLIGKISLGR